MFLQEGVFACVQLIMNTGSALCWHNMWQCSLSGGPWRAVVGCCARLFLSALESFSSITTHGFLIIGIFFSFYLFFFSHIYIYLSYVFYVLKKYRSLALFELRWKQLLGQLALRCEAVLPGEEACCQHGCRPCARAHSFPLIRVVGWVLRIASRQEIPSRAVGDVMGRGKTS